MSLENATVKELEDYAKNYVALQTKLMKLVSDSLAQDDDDYSLEREELPKNPSKNGTKIDPGIPLNVRIEAVRVYNFEIDLANTIRLFSPSPVDQESDSFKSEANKTAEKVPLTLLDSEYNFINWTRTFGLLPGPPNVTHVYVQDISYLQALKELFKRHSKETIDNYLCWSFFARFLPYSTRRMKRLYEDFKRQTPDSAGFSSTSGSPSTDPSSRHLLPRWKECVHVTCDGLKLPTSVLYYISKEDELAKVKLRVTDMIAKIKDAFAEVMDHQEWIKSHEIRKLLAQRIHSIESRVALPDYLLNTSVVDDLYFGLNVDSATFFLDNVINVTRHEVFLDLQKLNQNPEPDKDWLLQPLVSNAYFDAMNDDISEFLFVLSLFSIFHFSLLVVIYICLSLLCSSSLWNSSLSTCQRK